MSESDEELIKKCHAEAVKAGRDSYLDPKTGYSVMTESFLKAQGSCCRSSCRHCPYGYSPLSD